MFSVRRLSSATGPIARFTQRLIKKAILSFFAHTCARVSVKSLRSFRPFFSSYLVLSFLHISSFSLQMFQIHVSAQRVAACSRPPSVKGKKSLSLPSPRSFTHKCVPAAVYHAGSGAEDWGAAVHKHVFAKKRNNRRFLQMSHFC